MDRIRQALIAGLMPARRPKRLASRLVAVEPTIATPLDLLPEMFGFDPGPQFATGSGYAGSFGTAIFRRAIETQALRHGERES